MREHWTEHSRQTFSTEEEAEHYASGMREVIRASNQVGHFATSTEQIDEHTWAAILWKSD